MAGGGGGLREGGSRADDDDAAAGRGAEALFHHHYTATIELDSTRQRRRLWERDRGGKQRCGGLHVDYGGCRKERRRDGRQAITYVRTNQLLLRRGTAQGRPSLLFAV